MIRSQPEVLNWLRSCPAGAMAHRAALASTNFKFEFVLDASGQ